MGTRTNKVNYPLATKTWDEAEYNAIQRVIDKDIFSMSEEVSSFESDFAKFFGKRFAVMVNSGSSANLLMIASLFYKKKNPLRPGDEIIVPAVSWSTTYMPLQQYNLKVKFVDVDLQTLNFDLGALREAVSDKTRAIFAVNLLGNPNDFDAINEIIGDKDIYLLEDNCESLGAKYKEKYVGGIGLMGSFSTFFSHHISTMEGGLMVTDDEELYHVALSIRAHGWTRNLPKINKVTGEKSDIPFDEAFKFVLPGYNLRPLEMSGAIGKEQLKKVPMIVENRRKNAKIFKDVTKRFDWLITQKEVESSSWFGFSMIVKPESGISRRELLSLLDVNGVEYRPIVAGNFTKNEVVKYFDYTIHGDLTNSDIIDEGGFFIGNHHYEMENEFSVLNEVLNQMQG